MGGCNLSGHKAEPCQQGRLSGPLSAHLRGRGALALVSAAPTVKEAYIDFSFVSAYLFSPGICGQLLPGKNVGAAVVGLQRLVPEYKRADLSCQRLRLRVGRHGAELFSSALLYAGLPLAFTEVESCPEYPVSCGFYSGCHLLRSEAAYGGQCQLWQTMSVMTANDGSIRIELI